MDGVRAIAFLMFLLLSSAHMRAAAILGLGSSAKDLKPFQVASSIGWHIGMPSSPGEADVILLLGGDGTIHRHLGSLVALGLPVLIVPAGSGNDFARALGLPRIRDSRAAWQSFLENAGNQRSIDLGLITPADRSGARYFCCVAGVGLDAEVARRANHIPRWLRRHGGYLFSLLPTLFTFAALPMKILTTTSTSHNWTLRSEQPTLLAVFANTSTYGGGMKIAPQARLDDGLLDVCVVGAFDPFKLFCLFPTVYAGRHLGISKVEYFQSERARIETGHPLDVYADGEFVCRTPAEFSIESRALKFIVPAA